ncbi:MAG: hypothetical protein ACEQSL_06935 [Sediminibacterium sp.]
MTENRRFYSYFLIGTALLEIVEDIREAFAKGIRKNYIIPTV